MIVDKSKTTVGKREMIRTLIEAGFQPDEASRIYSVVSEKMESALRDGHTVYWKKLFKIVPVRYQPREFWDNMNHKIIYYGERFRHKLRMLIK